MRGRRQKWNCVDLEFVSRRRRIINPLTTVFWHSCSRVKLSPQTANRSPPCDPAIVPSRTMSRAKRTTPDLDKLASAMKSKSRDDALSTYNSHAFRIRQCRASQTRVAFVSFKRANTVWPEMSYRGEPTFRIGRSSQYRARSLGPKRLLRL